VEQGSGTLSPATIEIKLKNVSILIKSSCNSFKDSEAEFSCLPEKIIIKIVFKPEKQKSLRII